MDSDRFDAIVRSLGIAAPRREALGGALGAGLGILIVVLGTEDATAKRKGKKRKKCKGAFKKKCGKKCVNLATDGNNCGVCGNACATGVCIHGACTCLNKADCPGDCLCATREQGDGFVGGCQDGVDVNDTCNEDADCPFRSFCRSVGNNCSRPCLV